MNKTLRVLHVSSALSWRGGEQQIVNLIEGLNSIDKSIEQILFCSKNSAIEKYATIQNIKFKSAQKKSGFDLLYIIKL